MPKGPRGEKRPADVIGSAVKVMRIATGEEAEGLDTDLVKSAAAEMGALGGRLGRANTTPEDRAEQREAGSGEAMGTATLTGPPVLP